MLNGCQLAVWAHHRIADAHEARGFCGTAAGAGKTWFTALNIVVFAPMPRARCATAMALLLGVPLSKRTA